MKNERIFLFIFLFLSLLFLINPCKNLVHSFFLDLLYYPAVILKENVEELRSWEKEKKILLSNLRKSKTSLFPAYKIYYDPLFPPHFITLSKPENLDSESKIILQNGNFAGIIEKIEKNKIVARTIFSSNFKMGVIDKRSKVIGVLKSTESILLDLNYIPYWADVKEGDTLLTSGIGGVAPAGIPIGIIHKILKKEGEVFLKVEVKPLFDPTKLSIFLIR